MRVRVRRVHLLHPDEVEHHLVAKPRALLRAGRLLAIIPPGHRAAAAGRPRGEEEAGHLHTDQALEG